MVHGSSGVFSCVDLGSTLLRFFAQHDFFCFLSFFVVFFLSVLCDLILAQLLTITDRLICNLGSLVCHLGREQAHHPLFKIAFQNLAILLLHEFFNWMCVFWHSLFFCDGFFCWLCLSWLGQNLHPIFKKASQRLVLCLSNEIFHWFVIFFCSLLFWAEFFREFQMMDRFVWQRWTGVGTAGKDIAQRNTTKLGSQMHWPPPHLHSKQTQSLWTPEVGSHEECHTSWLGSFWVKTEFTRLGGHGERKICCQMASWLGVQVCFFWKSKLIGCVADDGQTERQQQSCSMWSPFLDTVVREGMSRTTGAQSGVSGWVTVLVMCLVLSLAFNQGLKVLHLLVVLFPVFSQSNVFLVQEDVWFVR